MSALHALAAAAAATPAPSAEWVAPGGIIAGLIAAFGLVAREVRMIRADGYADMRRQRDEAIEERDDARADADRRLSEVEKTVSDLRTEVEGLRNDQQTRDDAHRREMRAQEDRHRDEQRAAEERHRAELRVMQDQNLHITQRNYELAQHLARHGLPLPPEQDDTRG